MLKPGPRKIVNDVDVDALEDIAASARSKPEQATVAYGVATRWTGQMRSEGSARPIRLGNGRTIDRQFKIAADEPEEILGTDAAPNPQELLLAALNACMTVRYVEGASLRGINLTKLEIETEGTLDLRGLFQLSELVPPGYPAIRYVVRIAGDGTPRQFEEIHAEVQQVSPNYDSFARSIRMEGELLIED